MMIERAAKRFNTDKYTIYLIISLSVFVILQIVKSAFMGVHQDEANWWLATKDLHAGYFLQPPFITYELLVFTKLFGDNPVALRLGSILFTTGTISIAYLFFKELFENAKWALLTALLIMVMPVTNYWLILAHQDAPFIFFWILTMFLIWKAVSGENGKYWYLAGIFSGFMLLCKLQSALFLICVLLFLAFTKKARRWLSRKEPYIAFLTTLLMFVPTLLWYISHDFEPITYQLGSRPGFVNNGLIDYFVQMIKHIGWCSAMTSFFIYLLCLFGIGYCAFYGFKKDSAPLKYLFFFSAPVVLFFAITTGPPYWSLPGLLVGLIAGMGALMELVSREAGGLLSRVWKPTLAICCFLVAGALTITSVYSAFTTSILHNGWNEFAHEIIKVEDTMAGEEPYLAGPYHWIVNEAAYHCYQLDRDLFAGYSLVFRDYETVNFGVDSQYEPWIPLEELEGKNIIFIDQMENPDGYQTPLAYWLKRLPGYFETVEDPVVYIDRKNGSEFKTYYIFKCYGFKGPNSEVDMVGNIKEYVNN